MKFVINRASNFTDMPPCDEAVPESITWINKIGNQVTIDVFTIEISTFSQLWNFIEKYGDIVIAKETSYGFGSMPEITIYDYWIE